MSAIPPDWKNDSKIWDALGKLPKSQASSNFTYLVRQRLDRPVPQDRSRILEGFSFRNWTFGWATAAAAFAIVLGWQVFHWGLPWAKLNPAKNGAVELAQLAQNYELIQDIEVIEHLDEL